jgi:hypothetical protein
MFQYVYESSGSMMRASLTPFALSSGLRFAPSSTRGASGPSMFIRSTSSPWNASRRAWSSSMIEISTRPIAGIDLPFISLITAASAGSSEAKLQVKPR